MKRRRRVMVEAGAFLLAMVDIAGCDVDWSDMCRKRLDRSSHDPLG